MGIVKVISHQVAKDFLQKVEAFLIKDEALNNLPLGVLTRLANSQENEKKERYFYHIETSEGVKCVFMRTPPHLWIISSPEDVSEEVIRIAVEFLHQEKLAVPGVIGTRSVATRFSKQWENLTGEKIEVHMEQLIYKLTTVNDIPITKGELVQAQAGDENLVKQWLFQFAEQTDEAIIAAQAEEMAERFVKQGTLHFWKVNGAYVSMANSSRATKTGITVNAVFTPDEYKHNGYATSCVWKLTEKLLKEGYSFCSLYTDAANQSSNSIYQKIGYQRIGDSIVLYFNKVLNE